MISSAALWHPEPGISAAWGTFGALFTAMAAAHTLYAPRAVSLGRWQRVALLGLCLALAIGSEFSFIMVAPMALGFMLYLAPTRPLAATAIWAAACALAGLLLFASYWFDAPAFRQGLTHASFLELSWRTLTMPEAYRHTVAELAESGPALTIAWPLALVVYLSWRRTRYFGNAAPLLVSLALVLLRVLAPHLRGPGLCLAAVPFLSMFVAGVAADLVETRWRGLVLACVSTLVSAGAVWNLFELASV
jgi:hypothetical protein